MKRYKNAILFLIALLISLLCHMVVWTLDKHEETEVTHPVREPVEAVVYSFFMP